MGASRGTPCTGWRFSGQQRSAGDGAPVGAHRRSGIPAIRLPVEGALNIGCGDYRQEPFAQYCGTVTVAVPSQSLSSSSPFLDRAIDVIVYTRSVPVPDRSDRTLTAAATEPRPVPPGFVTCQSGLVSPAPVSSTPPTVWLSLTPVIVSVRS